MSSLFDHLHRSAFVELGIITLYATFAVILVGSVLFEPALLIPKPLAVLPLWERPGVLAAFGRPTLAAAYTHLLWASAAAIVACIFASVAAGLWLTDEPAQDSTWPILLQIGLAGFAAAIAVGWVDLEQMILGSGAFGHVEVPKIDRSALYWFLGLAGAAVIWSLLASTIAHRATVAIKLLSREAEGDEPSPDPAKPI